MPKYPVSIADLLAEGYNLTSAAYFTQTSKHPKIQALLRELGFFRSHKNYGCFICEEEKWLVCLTHHDKWAIPRFEGVTEEGYNNIAHALRCDDFPVDRILRTKRLRALLS